MLFEKCVEQDQPVYSSIFSLFVSPILVAVISSLREDIYLHGSSDDKFYIATFQKKNMIHKKLFLRHGYPCLPLKIFELLNKREKRSNNLGKTVAIFPHNFRETVDALVRLVAIRKA